MTAEANDDDNFKVKLHKICQKNHLEKPVYSTSVVETEKKCQARYRGTCEFTGPDGKQVFGEIPAVKIRKIAEHLAAEHAYHQFVKRYPDASGVPKKAPKVSKKKVKVTNKKDFIAKLNKIAKSQGIPYPTFKTKPSTEGSHLCACRIDTPEGEHYSTARGKSEYASKQSAALAMINLLEEDKRARTMAQGLEVDTQNNRNAPSKPLKKLRLKRTTKQQ